MYKVQPKGLNIKDNDRNVPDGFLQESINLQWRDGSHRPIANRLSTTIPDDNNTENGIIMHKVSDEDQINVLSFQSSSGKLIFYGKIIDGVFTASPSFITGFPTITDYDSLSFTILNGIIYFMSVTQEFYYRVQYNETDDEYEVKDMYAWKSLIPFYPRKTESTVIMLEGGETSLLSTLCGIITFRFTLVLNTGEEVLHSPVYAAYMYSLNRYSGLLAEGSTLTNIHGAINTNLEFADNALLEEEISSINIYASVPYYLTKTDKEYGAGDDTDLDEQYLLNQADSSAQIQRMAEEPYYLVKTLDKPAPSTTDNNIVFFVDAINPDIDFGFTDYFKVDVSTIAAGNIMPVDNFSYHRVYGKITSNNGRLIVSNPTTILSEGSMRSLAIGDGASKQGFRIDTEDGNLEGIAYSLDKLVAVLGDLSIFRGVLSYPDTRATYTGGSISSGSVINLYKTRANKAHNMANSFKYYLSGINPKLTVSINDDDDFEVLYSSEILFFYGATDEQTAPNPPIIDPVKYDSNNRFQFSEAGEFAVWPAINSYRVGEGKIIFVGSNSIDPANTDYISPLLIGTSDGIYTANFDPTGANLIQSITRAAKLPALSDKNVVIDQNLIYVSDKGLILINNGRVLNLTEKYFPENGSGNLPSNNTVYPNYDLLTPGLSGTSHRITDIVDYMKGALFAYDGRRNNVWCSNPNKSFSLIFNISSKQWTMSTYVFNEVIDYGAFIDDVYSRSLVRSNGGTVDILSGEDTDQVEYLLLTRAIKIQGPDQYKKIQRLISRCQLYRSDDDTYFTLGVWGKQDVNIDKVSIPLVAYNDDNTQAFPGDIRQDIPVGRMKGKYKTITILQGGKSLPESSIDNYEIVAIPVENNILR